MMTPGMACVLVVTEPMTDEQLEELADTGDVSGLPFVSVNLAYDYEDAAQVNVFVRRSIISHALAEFGVEAWGFDEYGWQ